MSEMGDVLRKNAYRAVGTEPRAETSLPVNSQSESAT